MFANQNTNDDLNETNAIEGEEQVLELDEFNADYLFGIDFSKLWKKITDKLAGLKEVLGPYFDKIKDKLSEAANAVGNNICPGKPEEVLTWFKNKIRSGAIAAGDFVGLDMTAEKMKQYFSERKRQIQEEVCPPR